MCDVAQLGATRLEKMLSLSRDMASHGATRLEKCHRCRATWRDTIGKNAIVVARHGATGFSFFV
jgi:hypothetical protein